jgi:hypothetical protein
LARAEAQARTFAATSRGSSVDRRWDMANGRMILGGRPLPVAGCLVHPRLTVNLKNYTLALGDYGCEWVGLGGWGFGWII